MSSARPSPWPLTVIARGSAGADSNADVDANTGAPSAKKADQRRSQRAQRLHMCPYFRRELSIECHYKTGAGSQRGATSFCPARDFHALAAECEIRIARSADERSALHRQPRERQFQFLLATLRVDAGDKPSAISATGNHHILARVIRPRNRTSSQLRGTWRELSNEVGRFRHAFGCLRVMLDPGREQYGECQARNALLVRRSIPLMRSSTIGVKSIGSKTFRVKGSMAACVGSSSAFFCENVTNSSPRTASVVIRKG